MVLLRYFTKISLYIIVSTLVYSHSVQAEVMTEGYYKILSGKVHVGFVIQRFSFDKSTKTFSSVYYIKTNQLAGNITEGLKATANDKFEPLSYQYTTTVGKQAKVINGEFTGNKMKLTVSNGQTSNTFEKTMPKGTFLSTFLAYMMLSRGLEKGKKFTYSAIAEEDGEIFSGQAFVEKNVVEAGIPALRILNDFKGSKFISVMTPKAEVLKTKSPVQHIETQLVGHAPQATAGFQLDTKSLKLLFGDIPTGKKNPLAMPRSLPAKASMDKKGKAPAAANTGGK